MHVVSSRSNAIYFSTLVFELLIFMNININIFIDQFYIEFFIDKDKKNVSASVLVGS